LTSWRKIISISTFVQYWCENSGAHWLRRQTPNNQLVGKIRLPLATKLLKFFERITFVVEGLQAVASVRKRTWTASTGEIKTAWVVDTCFRVMIIGKQWIRSPRAYSNDAHVAFSPKTTKPPTEAASETHFLRFRRRNVFRACRRPCLFKSGIAFFKFARCCFLETFLGALDFRCACFRALNRLGGRHRFEPSFAVPIVLPFWGRLPISAPS
jgi:hypothetical protein